MKRLLPILAAALLLTFSGCFSGGYSFTGAQIPAEAQTFSVTYIPNNAAMVAPTLSNDLTEALRDRFIRQTRLSQVPDGGDLAIEGEITGYIDAPAGISADEMAETMRLTVTVNIRFVNLYSPEWSFEQGQSFSATADYPGNRTLIEMESSLIPEIVETLVDNIFNASVANW